MAPTIDRTLIGLSAVLLIGFGVSWAALFPMAILLSRVVVPNSRSIDVWPYGLLVFQGLSLTWHIALWLLNVEGLNVVLSKLILISMVLIGVFYPSAEQDNQAKEENKPNMATIFGLICIGILYFVVVLKTPVLINAHLGGGDHSNHVNFAYSFISHVNRDLLPSPLSISGYAHSVHFSVSLVSSASIQNFDGTVLGLVFRDFAFFDAFTLIAVLQLSAAMLPRLKRTFLLYSLLGLVPVMLLVRVPNLVSHFWLSGFSTSLFALFVLIAVLKYQMLDTSLRGKLFIALVSSFILAGVYQPFALVPLTVVAMALFNSACSANPKNRLLSFFISLSGPLILIVLIFQISGETSVISETLMRDGAFLEPGIMVFGLLILPILFLTGFTKVNLQPLLMHASLLSVIFGFWISSQLLGADGQLVYYVAKLIWTGVALGIVITGTYIVILLLTVFAEVRRFLQELVALTLIITSTLMIGVNPLSRFSFPNGSWFVDHLTNSEIKLGDYTVALNPQDRFSSHLANVALTETSPIARSFDLLILSELSIDELCAESYNLRVNRILTSKDGMQELLESGCGRNGQNIVQARQ